MRIALCDDEAAQTALFEQYLDHLRGAFPRLDHEVFDSGESLLEYYQARHRPFDVVFLDIEMGGMNGLQTAGRLRSLDEGLILIYVSSHQEYVFDAFDANPMRFLIKPVNAVRFKEVLRIAQKRLDESSHSILAVCGRRQMRFCCSDLLYLESDRRKVQLHTVQGKVYETYGKLDDWARKLASCDFIQVHKSYLVNMACIASFETAGLALQNGKIIPVSEGRRREAKAAYFKYVMKDYQNDK